MIGEPFHRMMFCAVRTSLFFTGSTSGLFVGGVACGKSMLTEWVATGMVMMNMMRSTSMTSINGVVFISIIGEPSSLPPLIAIGGTPVWSRVPGQGA